MPTLDWIGKKAVVNHHRDVPYRLIHCDKDKSVGDPDAGNLLVQGDNLEALKALLQDENVWLNQLQLAELFQTTKQNISLHIKNVFKDGELDEAATVKEYLTVQTEGRRAVSRGVAHYNLDMIIAVGFRVRSTRGTQFRQWANARLGEYIIKGFAMDDERLSQSRHDYFDELVRRVRRIRVSERRYYQKITDIFATSMDYDAKAEITKTFFATVQNKFHFAIHGMTAPEVIKARANASQLPADIELAAHMTNIAVATGGRVHIDPETRIIRANGALSDYDRNALKLVLPEAAAKAIDALVHRSRGARLKAPDPTASPIRFAVPQLTVRAGEAWQLFDRAHFLDIPWKLEESDPAPILDFFVPPRNAADEAHIDIDEKQEMKVTFVADLHEQLSLALAIRGWTKNALVNWIDRRLPYSSRRDITRVFVAKLGNGEFRPLLRLGGGFIFPKGCFR
jgi:Virulence protein RhuM family